MRRPVFSAMNQVTLDSEVGWVTYFQFLFTCNMQLHVIQLCMAYLDSVNQKPGMLTFKVAIDMWDKKEVFVPSVMIT